MYKGDPSQSGMLRGGGRRHPRKRRRRPLKHFDDVMLSDTYQVKIDVPDFDPDHEQEYTRRELVLLAEKILLEDDKSPREDPMWLNSRMILRRQKREIYTASGTPDPSYVQGLYWRSHPEGRRIQTEERRKKGASYYV